MVWRLTCLFCLAITAGETLGQDAEREIRKPLGKFEKLPEPLDDVIGNVHDFEDNGTFTITGVRFGVKGFGDDEALIWSLTTNNAVSSQYVVTHFNKLRNVRFFKSQKRIDEEKPPFIFRVYSTRLFYSERIASDAANGITMRRDDVFEVWIYLKPKAQNTIVNEDSNRVEFSQALRDIGRDPRSRY